jgi:hypothetical protein
MKCKYFILIIFLVAPFLIWGQQNTQTFRKDFCHNTFKNIDVDGYKKKIKRHQLKHGHDEFVVRIFVHIMRRNDGTGGITEAEAYDAIQQLNSVYSPHDICFSLLGVDEINSSGLLAFDLDNSVFNPNFFEDWEDLVQTNAHQEAIDIYMFPHTGTAVNGGLAMGFIFQETSPYVNDAVIIGGQVGGHNCIGSQVLSHEIAHVLGLFHVFSTTSCVELVDRSNCEECGDLICDTEASFGLAFNENFVDEVGCTYTGTVTDANGDLYILDPENIMEYTLVPCLNHFTEGQGDRMKGFLENEDALQALIVPNDYVLDANNITTGTDILYAANHTLEVDGISFGADNYQNLELKASESINLLPGTKIEKGINGFLHIEVSCNTLDNINSARIIPVKDIVESRNHEISKDLKRSSYKENTFYHLYPNPNNGNFTIELSNSTLSQEVAVKIISTIGQVVHSEIMTSKQTNLDVSHLSSGIYYLQLDLDGKILTQKLIIHP